MATRNEAPLLLALSLTVLVSIGASAESLMLVGKPASWETWGEAPASATPKNLIVESLETPNQARHRLGLPIEASFPAQDQGSDEETPNHRRQRLSLQPGPATQALLAQAR